MVKSCELFAVLLCIQRHEALNRLLEGLALDRINLYVDLQLFLRYVSVRLEVVNVLGKYNVNESRSE